MRSTRKITASYSWPTSGSSNTTRTTSMSWRPCSRRTRRTKPAMAVRSDSRALTYGNLSRLVAECRKLLAELTSRKVDGERPRGRVCHVA